MKCPSEAELNDYAEGHLTPQRRWQLAAHLQACARCQATVREFSALQEALDGLLTAPATGAAVADHPAEEDLAVVAEGRASEGQRRQVMAHVSRCPECAAVLGSLPRPRRRRSAMFWVGGGGVAAAAALLLALSLSLFGQHAPRQTAAVNPMSVRAEVPTTSRSAKATAQSGAGHPAPRRLAEAAPKAPPPVLTTPAPLTRHHHLKAVRHVRRKAPAPANSLNGSQLAEAPAGLAGATKALEGMRAAEAAQAQRAERAMNEGAMKGLQFEGGREMAPALPPPGGMQPEIGAPGTPAIPPTPTRAPGALGSVFGAEGFNGAVGGGENSMPGPGALATGEAGRQSQTKGVRRATTAPGKAAVRGELNRLHRHAWRQALARLREGQQQAKTRVLRLIRNSHPQGESEEGNPMPPAASIQPNSGASGSDSAPGS